MSEQQHKPVFGSLDFTLIIVLASGLVTAVVIALEDIAHAIESVCK